MAQSVYCRMRPDAGDEQVDEEAAGRIVAGPGTRGLTRF